MSLIDLLVYIGVISLSVSAFVGFALAVAGVRSRAESAGGLLAECRDSWSLISRAVETAEAIAGPLPGSVGDELAFLGPDGTGTIGLANGRLRYQTEGEAAVYLTGEETLIEHIEFRNLGLAGRDSIRFELDLVRRQDNIEQRSRCGVKSAATIGL
jgi:hypothetical protein